MTVSISGDEITLTSLNGADDMEISNLVIGGNGANTGGGFDAEHTVPAAIATDPAVVTTTNLREEASTAAVAGIAITATDGGTNDSAVTLSGFAANAAGDAGVLTFDVAGITVNTTLTASMTSTQIATAVKARFDTIGAPTDVTLTDDLSGTLTLTSLGLSWSSPVFEICTFP